MASPSLDKRQRRLRMEPWEYQSLGCVRRALPSREECCQVETVRCVRYWESLRSTVRLP